MHIESQKYEVRGTKSEIRSQKYEVRSTKSAVRSQLAQTSGFRLQTSDFVLQICLCLVMLVCAVPMGAQESKPDTPPKATNKTITLSGCVERAETTPTQYTLVDAEEGTTYRLTGTDVRDYVGKKVQIMGAPPTGRLKVAGGLWPSPNVAAQAGAMDPARAATAAAGGSAGPGTVSLPEFKVKSVRPVSGSCRD
jgi:hypothetical protein